MPHIPESVLSRYAVSPQSGFLPNESPIEKLGDGYYSPWETIVVDLPGYIQSGTVRSAIESLPILSTSKLQGEPEWRRAYLVLAFFTHAYVWGGQKPIDRLPPSVSRPFVEVSSHLELPPCATYAAVCLWNYSTSFPNGLTDPDNLSAITSFTGTKDEEWFYMVSVAIEAAGARLIRQMLEAINAVNSNNTPRLTSILTKLSTGLVEVTQILGRMGEKCRPSAFFHQLRPFLAGSKNMSSAGLPNGLFYDLGDGTGEWHQYSGGSNAQSSLIQTFDIFLGVQHSATGDPDNASANFSFLQSMRDYMPGPHRRFLEYLTEITNVRDFAFSHHPDSAVRNAYNSAVASLVGLRDKHMQLVARYILLAAKTHPVKNSSDQVNLATATAKIKDTDQDSEFHGTGGTSLMPFLKQTRDATRAAARYEG